MINSLLTRKQAWRRQNKTAKRQEQHDILFKEFSRDNKLSNSELPARSFSAPTVSSLIEYALSSKQWGTTGNLKENVSTRIKKKMGIRFDVTLRVVLIPSRKDYDDSNLTQALWWNENDYKIFREAAFVELEFLKNSELNVQSTSEALEILYQPHEEIYSEDDDNFFVYLDDKSHSFFSMRSVTPEITTMTKTKNNDDTTDLFGKSKLQKSDNIFEKKINLNNNNINNNPVALNIQGFRQISKSEVKKRDDDKTKEKEKEISFEERIRVHPLATLCG